MTKLHTSTGGISSCEWPRMNSDSTLNKIYLSYPRLTREHAHAERHSLGIGAS
jgi:hypothetical protein